eukprot:jgi/Bigna1/144783/aug1.91_g19491
MEIVVTDRQDQILSLKVRGGDEKVLAVKEKVRDSCNICMDQIKLKFKGVWLRDDSAALYNCGVNEGDTILLDNGPSFQVKSSAVIDQELAGSVNPTVDLAVMYPYKKGRKAVRVWNTFDRNDIDRVVRNAREENLKEVEEGLSKWISSVLDFRVSPPLCLRLASGNELCMLLEAVTGKPILGVHKNDEDEKLGRGTEQFDEEEERRAVVVGHIKVQTKLQVTLLGFKEASEVIMVVRQRAEMLAMLYRVKSPL